MGGFVDRVMARGDCEDDIQQSIQAEAANQGGAMPGTMAKKGSSFRDRFNNTQKKHTDQYTVNKGLMIVGLLLEAKQEAEREEIYLREQELALSPLGLLMPKAKVEAKADHLNQELIDLNDELTALQERLLGTKGKEKKALRKQCTELDQKVAAAHAKSRGLPMSTKMAMTDEAGHCENHKYPQQPTQPEQQQPSPTAAADELQQPREPQQQQELDDGLIPMPGKDVVTVFWNTQAEGDEWFMVESTDQMNTMAAGLHLQLHSKATSLAIEAAAQMSAASEDNPYDMDRFVGWFQEAYAPWRAQAKGSDKRPETVPKLMLQPDTQLTGSFEQQLLAGLETFRQQTFRKEVEREIGEASLDEDGFPLVAGDGKLVCSKDTVESSISWISQMLNNQGAIDDKINTYRGGDTQRGGDTNRELASPRRP